MARPLVPPPIAAVSAPFGRGNEECAHLDYVYMLPGRSDSFSDSRSFRFVLRALELRPSEIDRRAVALPGRSDSSSDSQSLRFVLRALRPSEIDRVGRFRYKQARVPRLAGLGIAYMGNHKANWSKLTVTDKAEQSAHERARFFHLLNKTRHAGAGPRDAQPQDHRRRRPENIILALPSFTGHKELPAAATRPAALTVFPPPAAAATAAATTAPNPVDRH